MNTEAGLLTRSNLDSERFGLEIYRGTLESIEEKSLFSYIFGHRIDIAIIRVPPALSPQLYRVRRFGLDPFHADTLVYYKLNLEQFTPRALRNVDLTFSEADSRDEAVVAEMVSQIFEKYQSHYHSNPLLGASDILAGYREWALGHREGSRKLWIARRGNQPIAFACCRFNPEAKCCEGVLYGVHPQHAGGGVYGDLIRFTQAAFKQLGYKSMKVSTQVGNFAVQKVWTREGFVLVQAFDTFHINALLSDRGGHVEIRPARFSRTEVESFGALSGDLNPVHFDDEAARLAGFRGRITHGLLPAMELSRYFGMELPGPGTLFVGLRMTFLQPIYPDREYELRIRFVRNPEFDGFNIAVATICDPEGHPCLLAYNDLLRRTAKRS